MSAKVALERHAIFLQELAFEVLSNKDMKLADLHSLVGDPSLFDNDMCSVLSILYMHNNLVAPDLSQDEQPITMLLHLREKLLSFKALLPRFQARYEFIKSKTNNSFVNEDMPFGGGDVHALDKPLNRIRNTLYHLKEQTSSDPTSSPIKMFSTPLIQYVEDFISSVKNLETEGKHYEVKHYSSDVAGKKRTVELDASYDALAARINAQTKTSPKGPSLTLYGLTNVYEKPFERVYVISPNDETELLRAVHMVSPGWDLQSKWERIDTILVPVFRVTVKFSENGTTTAEQVAHNVKRTVATAEKYSISVETRGNTVFLESTNTKTLQDVAKLIQVSLGAELSSMERLDNSKQKEEEKEALLPVSRKTEEGSKVMTVRLPFTPEQIDDAFPSVEIRSEQSIGRNLSKFVLELINKTRFSGFVEFDDSYRMLILWANAPADDPQDQDGTFRDQLVKMLLKYQPVFTKMMGQKPVVHKIKTGAALYFPTPIGIKEVVDKSAEIVGKINAINAIIDNMEQHTGENSVFNRNIDNDELEDLNVEEVA